MLPAERRRGIDEVPYALADPAAKALRAL